jgi:hypothetical protein
MVSFYGAQKYNRYTIFMMMNRIFTIIALLNFAANANAQTDTVATSAKDTIRIGNMIIIRDGRDKNKSYFDSTSKTFKRKNDNVTTNWCILDIGFNQVNDQTNYSQAITEGWLPAGANGDWFEQRNFKSTNINIWIVMQRLNVIKHVVNLKYGFGLELNNYKYRGNIRFQETGKPLVIMDNVDYRKNKLAADYLTVPLMLNFNFSPHKQRGFGISAGVSGGFLYSSRQKTNGGGMGKVKYHDDFELRKFKLAYIGEISLGWLKLYGSYATKSMFENGLDQTPYSFGIRISN